MKYRSATPIFAFVLATTLSLSVTHDVIADSRIQADQVTTTQTQNIEHFSVTYRNAFDYALCQHTTEMLTRFHAQHSDNIVIEARNQSHDMAEDFIATQIVLNIPDSEELTSSQTQVCIIDCKSTPNLGR